MSFPPASVVQADFASVSGHTPAVPGCVESPSISTRSPGDPTPYQPIDRSSYRGVFRFPPPAVLPLFHAFSPLCGLCPQLFAFVSLFCYKACFLVIVTVSTHTPALCTPPRGYVHSCRLRLLKVLILFILGHVLEPSLRSVPHLLEGRIMNSIRTLDP